MKLVRQQHENGCVPACIAMILDWPYTWAVKLFYSNHNWNKRGSTTEMLISKLTKLKFKTKLTKPSNIKKLTTDAILVVEHDAYGPPGHQAHVVIWDHRKQRVWDPYPSKRRSMKRRLPLSEYQKSLVEIIKVYDI